MIYRAFLLWLAGHLMKNSNLYREDLMKIVLVSKELQ
jgi:hypothetical protein